VSGLRGRRHLARSLLVTLGLPAEPATFADDGLAFSLLPAPTGADLLAILDRVIPQVARRLSPMLASM